MTKIPAHVDVGCHRFTIRSDADTAAGLRENGNRAETRAERLLILLDPDLPQSLLAESLLHEVLHACWAQTPLRCAEGIKDSEEDIVTALAPLIVGVLRSSPELVALVGGKG